MTTLISIDPGLSSGVVVGTYSDTEPYKRTHAFQFGGGLMGFKRTVRLSDGEDWGRNRYSCLWVFRHSWDLHREEQHICPHWDTEEWETCGCEGTIDVSDTVVICEKFTPRPNGKGGLSLDSVEPLRIEGYLVGSGVMPDYFVGKKNPLWRQPSAQYFMGAPGESLATKKKKAREWRLEHDLHLTGKNVGQEDADDANSATMHAVSYLRSIKHGPTLEHYFKERNA